MGVGGKYCLHISFSGKIELKFQEECETRHLTRRLAGGPTFSRPRHWIFRTIYDDQSIL